MTSSSKDEMMYEYLQTLEMGMLHYKMICISIFGNSFRFLYAELTCMTVGYPAGFSISKAMWAEVENEIVVVWKRPEPQVNQMTEFIHCFDVCICSTEKKCKQTSKATSPLLMIKTDDAVNN